MFPLLAINLTNITNDSVISNLAQQFAPFLPEVFGTDSSGTSVFFGVFILIVFAGLCMMLRLSLDSIAAIGFPLVILMSMNGYLPTVVGYFAIVAGALIIALAVYMGTRR